jgi:HAD superfamily 5'-nucleotidase-like hydrolase
VADEIEVDRLAALRLNISSELKTRSVVPQRIVGGSDLFCNRELNMEIMEAVGFDMDFTLAQYTVDFDLLAYDGAKEKLVSWLGYPEEVRAFRYDQDLCRRGCVVDKKRGNVLKIDRFKYVRVATHGLTQLTAEQRKALYIQSFKEMQSFSGSNFASIDTPFSLVDACLFSQLVDLKDRLGLSKPYEALWTDMRKAVDRCHKDGVIKKTVAQDPSKYVIFDPNLFAMLSRYRSSGFKVFLLTNSLYDYTQVVMNYLEGRKAGDAKDDAWMDYFDVIIVGGNKPSFLTDEGKLPLLRVDSSSGKLENIDNIPAPDMVDAFLAAGKVFQGGNAQILHTLLKLSSGDRLLYVGDHVYADVMRSKRVLGWRYCTYCAP